MTIKSRPLSAAIERMVGWISARSAVMRSMRAVSPCLAKCAVKAAADNDTRAGGFAYIIAGFQGIVYAAQMGASVISCSWGGPGASQFEQDVVNIVTEEGSLVVAAAGNGGSADPSYPAGYEHVISVGAVNSADVKESYSNFGSTVDVFAPGGDFNGVNSTILSTYFPSTYQGLAGTSQASVCALSQSAAGACSDGKCGLQENRGHASVFNFFPKWRCGLSGIPPSPLIFWNDGVRARPPPKSLRNKDLYVKYSGIRS